MEIIVRSAEVYEGIGKELLYITYLYIINFSKFIVIAGKIAQDPEKKVAIQDYVYYRDGMNETSIYLERYDLVSCG